MNDIFVNEDISKPENRVNLALFHLQMIPEFHDWFCDKLKISTASIIYPVQNVGSGRPDYVVKIGNNTIGYIEVELGGENASQLNNYNFMLKGHKVFSITGFPTGKEDLSLQEISKYITKLIFEIPNTQAKISLQYLSKLIDNFINPSTQNSRQPVSDKVLANPFVNEFLESLVAYKPGTNITKPTPGYYYIDTVQTEGFSFRVYSRKSTSRSLSLLSISGGRSEITFLSATKYRKYLEHKNEKDVESFFELIVTKLKAPILGLGESNRVNVPISLVQVNLHELVEKITHLI